MGDEVGGISRHQSSVEGVEQSVLQDPSAGQHVDNGRALIEDEEDGSQDCDGTVDEDHDGQLGQVCQCKHARQDPSAQGQRGADLAPEGLP